MLGCGHFGLHAAGQGERKIAWRGLEGAVRELSLARLFREHTAIDRIVHAACVREQREITERGIATDLS